jgi:hypothetical protein
MPYHADVIGSLLRPSYLVEARQALADGGISNASGTGSGVRVAPGRARLGVVAPRPR